MSEIRLGLWELPLPMRAMLAVERVRMRYEERDNFVSDSDVLDAIDAWTTGACGGKADFYCTHSGCCDYQLLSVAVWGWLEMDEEDYGP